MATHELYLGGPPTRNYNLHMFPAPAFNDAVAPFNTIGPAAHKGPIGYNDKRRLAFDGTDHALADFVRENTIAQGDVLGAVLIPKNVLLLGFAVKVVTAGPATLSITPKLRGKAHTFAAIDAATAGETVFYPASGAAVAAISEGVASLAVAVFDNKPDMLDLTLTVLPAGGLGNLVLEVTPVFLTVDAGGIP
jgi:hypothetical protein